MTEKRFEYIRTKYRHYIQDVKKNGKYIEGKRGTYDDFDLDKLTDLLNELNDENDKLKQQLKTKHIVNKQYEELQKLKEENKELKKQLLREETDKKRLMTPLMKYKSYSFDEIVEDILNEPYYDNWWEDGFYELCWDEYLKEKGFDGCDEE